MFLFQLLYEVGKPEFPVPFWQRETGEAECAVRFGGRAEAGGKMRQPENEAAGKMRRPEMRRPEMRQFGN